MDLSCFLFYFIFVVVVEKVSGFFIASGLWGSGVPGGAGWLSFHHLRLLASQNGTGLADGPLPTSGQYLFLQILCLMLLSVPVHSCWWLSLCKK